MKMRVFTSILVVVLFCSCALEGANVIGPAGGYVFFDKGNYSDGWRYLECAPEDIGNYDHNSVGRFDLNEANNLVINFYYGGYSGWRIPNERELKMMTEVIPKISKGYLSAERTSYVWFSTRNRWERITSANSADYIGVYTIWAIREF